MVRRGIAGALLILAYGACGSDVDDRPATYAYIHAAILVPNCATSGCHSKVAQVGGISFEDYEQSYVFLLGPPPTGEMVNPPTGNLVIPGHPHDSKLLYLLRGSQTWKMPPDRPLPEADIDLIERWILEGAPR